MSKMSSFDVQYAAKHPYKVGGTYLTVAGSIILGVTGKLIKVHQYSISCSGTVAWSLNDSKPTGGTVDWGGYLTSNMSYLADKCVRPFIPYPGYICCTVNKGSALCLGTYAEGFGSGAGTIYIHAIYTDSDAS